MTNDTSRGYLAGLALQIRNDISTQESWRKGDAHNEVGVSKLSFSKPGFRWHGYSPGNT
jgi:hypothetical protein